MKKTTILIALCWLACCGFRFSLPVNGTAVNCTQINNLVVTNPEFESGDFTGWTTEWDNGISTIETSPVQCGSYSYKLVATDVNDRRQSTNVTGGNTYNLSAWFNISTYVDGAFFVDLYGNDCVYDSSQTKVTAATAGWAYKEISLSVPGDCSSVFVRIVSDSGSDFTGYVDQIRLVEE